MSRIWATLTRLSALALLASPAAANVPEHRSQAVLRAFQHEHPCPSTGKATGACPGYIKDHVKPLCAGGIDDPANLQWQTKADAAAKDNLERVECRNLKRGR